MSSLLIQLTPEVAFCSCPDGLPNKMLEIGGNVSTLPDCVAPWHASADLLVNDETGTCLGFTYKVDEQQELAALMASQAPNSVVRLVKGQSAYALRVYGQSSCDWFEIRFGVGEPNTYMIAASIDGFWFLDSTRTRLLAFGISDVSQMVSEFSLRLAPLLSLGEFIPRWV